MENVAKVLTINYDVFQQQIAPRKCSSVGIKPILLIDLNDVFTAEVRTRLQNSLNVQYYLISALTLKLNGKNLSKK